MCIRPLKRILVLVTVLASAILASIATAKKDGANELPAPTVVRPTDNLQFPLTGSATLDTVTTAEFDFDDGVGGPDPQGWTTVDETDQPVYFHVDDFAGLPPPFEPLGGNQSMWVGLRPSIVPPYDCWATLPGYGHNWRQQLQSAEFTVAGDVELSYRVRWDTEAGYDYMWVQYRSGGDLWTNLPVNGGAPLGHNGSGQMTETQTVLAAEHSGVIEFRFLFVSDPLVSDEDGDLDSDGAIVLDDIVVSDGAGTIDTQDFETEAVGSTQTSDGDWVASAAGVFGDYAALFDGTGVVQEDPILTNSSYLWGFFNNSPDNYGCGGFPLQLSVPLEKQDDVSPQFFKVIHNRVQSPILDITRDKDGLLLPANSPVLVSLDVYADMVLFSGVSYRLTVREFVDGCPTAWRSSELYAAIGKKWLRQTFDITPLIDSDATTIQIALYVGDVEGVQCQSHSPLFDNITVSRIVDVVTGVGDLLPAVATLHQNHPNPFNPTTTIRYTIAEPARVSLRVYSPSGALVRTLVDADQLYRAGGHVVEWDGRNDRGALVSSGIYFYRLSLDGASVDVKKMVMLK